MAKKPTPISDEDALPVPVGDEDLDSAIDSLRGVLKTDADGGTPFGGDFDQAEPASFDGADFGGGDFGGGDFGGGDFGGGSDFAADATGPADTATAKAPGSALSANHDLIMDIPIDVQIVLGTSRMQVSSLMSLEEGAIIGLDKRIGEPVDIMVNGRRIARGEITIMEGDDTRFGVKLLEVLGTRKA
ncbi:flagellar motor switch protein FliN [Rhizobiaceae bacterium BDR2-2]|uniref:Flagellar motor switch protein FliN n=1 Tax=Ectorhizobium quercum TaxID=2965071 RepID=A0AAE3MWD4_9HYPH|nr:flagellar motor switch protein FliN [Ectorhizobium quercum]MCX8996094.1 flagellar motor switch protein FliN [Ectorhizobium quercum]